MYAGFINGRKSKLAASLAVLSTLLIAPGAGAQQCPSTESAPRSLPAIKLAPSNNQYFYYNNQTTPLIGLSSEYLCHVAQPGEFTRKGIKVIPDREYCTWANHKAFIDRLAQSGLNKLRVWVGLNHSLGIDRNLGAPYTNEQPFTFANGKWNFDVPDQVYWDRLKCVIGYAGIKGVIVEVTLFDPWSGADYKLGPWYATRNVQGVGFTEKRFFAQYTDDPARTDNSGNSGARTEQEDLVKHAVSQLNAYPNLIWELANESDLPPGSGAAAARWQNRIAQVLIEEEAKPGRVEHPIIVETHSQGTIDALLRPVNNPYLNTADVVAAHYVTVEPVNGDYGAIELIRSKHGTTGFETRAFGFNETRSTPFPSVSQSARSEAWEFALNEGGLYDNYNLRYLDRDTGVMPVETSRVFNQLGVLKTFLLGLDLAAMSRDSCVAGCWLSGQGAYKTPPEPTCGGWTGSKYWAAMHSANNYVAYFHHSKDTADGTDNPFSRYEPPQSTLCSYQETTIKFKPDVAGRYLVEWVNPINGVAYTPSYTVDLLAGQIYSVPASQSYSYDIALRIRKQ